MNTVGERLMHVRGETNQRDFAKMLGVGARTYWNYEADERPPSADALRHIAQLGWNPAWVLTGQGPEKLGEQADPETVADVAAVLVGDQEAAQRLRDREARVLDHLKSGGQPESLAEDFAFVPYLRVKVAAGAGQVVESEQIVAWMAFRRGYLQMLGVPTAAACLVRVRGDSMEPDLRDGDTVLLDTTDNKVTDKAHAFAFRFEGSDELAVKRLRESQGELHISGSDHWPATVLKADQPRPLIIGRVRWSGRTWD
jgi:phage repressor protein C with HTH and peptisase S24 domain